MITNNADRQTVECAACHERLTYVRTVALCPSCEGRVSGLSDPDLLDARRYQEWVLGPEPILGRRLTGCACRLDKNRGKRLPSVADERDQQAAARLAGDGDGRTLGPCLAGRISADDSDPQ